MKKLPYCFFLVLLLHLLLFLSFALVLGTGTAQPEPPEEDAETSKHKPVPAYVYQEPQQPTITTETLKQQADSEGLFKKSPQKNPPEPTVAAKPAPADLTPDGQDPATVIAERQTDKPLIKLLSRATSKKLAYPKSAQDFRVTGKVNVQFYLTPAGEVSDVTLVGSSGSSVLDDAALTAVRAISPVSGVDKYISEPRYLVVGIIFEA